MLLLFVGTILVLANISDSIAIDTLAIDTIGIDPTLPDSGEPSIGGLNWWGIFLPGFIGALGVLFADAFKYLGTPEWNTKIFLKTKASPFVIVNAVALLLAALSTIENLTGTFEMLSGWIGEDLTALTTASLFAAATAIVDGILKRVK